MRAWSAERVAAAAGAELVRDGPPGPVAATIDSRAVGEGELFVGIPGARVDGGAFAAQAVAAGAWGALVVPERAAELVAGDEWSTGAAAPAAVFSSPDPVAALGRLARAWRRELACPLVGITGSTGKTSTKELLAALLAPHRRVVAGRANFNTEIGLPLELLRASADTEVVVLEMAMRGAGQIALLAEIAEPDVGVIVNIGPVHLEQLGSIEAIAAAKAELVAALRPGDVAIVPAGERLLDPHRRDDVEWVTFGPGGDVAATEVELPPEARRLGRNLLAAVAAARAVGVEPAGRIEVAVPAGRGGHRLTPRDVLVIDDCYNANPMSMRAALEELAELPRRRVAVLGDMLELGPEEAAYHAALGAEAAERGVEALVAVGPRSVATAEAFGPGARTAPDAEAAAALVRELVRPGDAVLVKASRGIGLERVVAALTAEEAG